MLVETAREAQIPILLLMGWLGYINAKRTYWNSMSPVVVPDKIDFDKNKFHIKNVGRGPAKNIQFSRYNHLVDFFDQLIEWRLEFIDPASLASNESCELEAVCFENGKPTSGTELIFCLLFPSKSQSPFKKKMQKTPLTIEYENVEGITYITTAIVENGSVKTIKVTRDYWHYKWLRFVYNKFERYRIYCSWRIKKWWRNHFRKAPLQGVAAQGKIK